IAVAMGPFSAMWFLLTDSTANWLTSCPRSVVLSVRPSSSSQSIWTPAASRMPRAAAATSGPIPSPGIKVTLCLIEASYCMRSVRPCRNADQLAFRDRNRTQCGSCRILLYYLCCQHRRCACERRPKEAMINLTPVASTKVKEIMNMQSPVPVALRVAVVGGGCSGFQYHMAFENQTTDADQIFEFDGLKVAVDQMSSMYLEGIEIDYIETIEGAGFKFNNPNVKSTCGCGSSFSV